jgi:hypothetical protein
MKIKTRDIDAPDTAKPADYTITIDLGHRGQIIMTFTDRDLGRQEFQRLKTQSQFGGVWISKITAQ